MSRTSSLIGFWNNKARNTDNQQRSAEAKIISPPKTRQENIKIRQWEKPGIGFAQNRQQSFTSLVSLPKPEEVAGQAVKKITYCENILSKSDNKFEKENVPEKRAGLDVKTGRTDSKCTNPLIKSSPTLAKPSSPFSSASTPSSSRPLSRLAKNKQMSPFAKFKQMETDEATSNRGFRPSNSVSSPYTTTSLSRNSSLPPSPRPTVTQAQLAVPGTGAVRSSSGAKEIILGWVQQTLRDYPLPLTNFSSHWANGLAFCALIHVFYPDSFDWSSLKAENRKYNFTLGFDISEELAGICPLLEVEDMLHYDKPDWKCVFTYVQSFYRRFRNFETPSKKHENPIPFKTQKMEDFASSPSLVTVTAQEAQISSPNTPHSNISTTHTSSSLSPTSKRETPTRSKSLVSAPASPADKGVTERKYLFNQSVPLDMTHVDFNTRQ